MVIPKKTIAKGAAGAGGGIVGTAAIGLDRAAQVAGDVLRGIFGVLPWAVDSVSQLVNGAASQTPAVIAALL